MNDCCCTDTSICPCQGFTHPSVIFNPPGQATLSYRVGDFTAFRRALLQSLPGEAELSSSDGTTTTQIWRPTGHGDLALQMMEWWAYLADILTFYNQRIANQAYLATADLPESVNGLVKLLGYRPRPGIGAIGTLAALANTPLPFTLPQGFAIQSKPGPGQQPQVFELKADTTVGVTPAGPVSPAQMLGAAAAQTHTVAQAQQGVSISSDTTPLVIAGKSSAVKKGDTILLLPKNQPVGGVFALATVTAVNTATDPTLGAITNIDVEWDQVSTNSDPGQWQLYKGGQSSQVWQYKVPAGVVISNTSTGAVINLQSVVRGIQGGDPIIFEDSSSLPATYQLLEAQSTTAAVWFANPQSASTPWVSQSNASIPSIAIPQTPLTVTSPVTFDASDGTANYFVWHSWTELADLIAMPQSQTVGGSGADSAVTLAVPSNITFPAPSGIGATTPVLVVDSVGNGATGAANSASSVILNDPVPLLIPPLQTYFNLLSVSRGKTVPSEIVGSGNATLAGQDFTLKNSPVTYLQDPASTSGDDYSSTIIVWVSGLKWQEVQSFFGQPPNAQVFVTSEDDSNNTHIVFGDGVNGSRLPTGANNVTASYRYGSGAAVPSPGTLTVVLKPWPGLRSIVNPVAVGGGADPDPPSQIRQYAPKSVLTFGRAVSADDFAVIAAQAPGVTRAAAAFGFDPIQQRPSVTVWVGDDIGARNSASAAITAAADPNRLPTVQLATQVSITLSLSIAVDPRYQPATVQTAVYAVLLDDNTGLFGVDNVGIGQVFFDSEIYAACLKVPGVLAVHNLELAKPRTRFTDELLWRYRSSPVVTCGQNRHDPGAGNYYFLPDDGSSLNIDLETS